MAVSGLLLGILAVLFLFADGFGRWLGFGLDYGLLAWGEIGLAGVLCVFALNCYLALHHCPMKHGSQTWEKWKWTEKQFVACLLVSAVLALYMAFIIFTAGGLIWWIPFAHVALAMWALAWLLFSK
jgi:hypothetical protein